MTTQPDKSREQLKRAFIAGFRHSNEGYNGEYTASSIPNPWDDEIADYQPFDQAFQEWIEGREIPQAVLVEDIDVTPNDELRELVEEWRRKAKSPRDPTESMAIESLANELERMIGDADE